MKKLILVILLLFSVDAYAWPWSKKNIEEISKEIEVKKVFYKALWISGKEEGERVYYIFRLTGNDIIQVGIIDEKQMKIFTIDNMKITSEYKYFGGAKKEEYIETHFPDITSLEIYMKSVD